VLVLLRTHGYNGPFNLDHKPARTTSNYGVFKVSFPTAVDRFITLWEIAGEAIADPIINEATRALETVDPRAILVGAFMVFSVTAWRLAIGLSRGRCESASTQSFSACFDNPRRTSGSPWS
jgi:hypothetical protein